MTRAEIEETVNELLDAAVKLQSLTLDVQGIATRIRERLDDTPPQDAQS